MDMRLDIRSRNVATGELMNVAEETQWLRNQLAPYASAPTQALVVAVNVDGATVGGGLGRAREIAVASVTPDGKLSQWRVEGVDWDVWHDQGPHDSHHGRIVSFTWEDQVSVVVSGHAGPPMVRTLLKLGILPVLGVGGDAQDATRSVAAEYQEMLAQSAGRGFVKAVSGWHLR